MPELSKNENLLRVFVILHCLVSYTSIFKFIQIYNNYDMLFLQLCTMYEGVPLVSRKNVETDKFSAHRCTISSKNHGVC